MHTECPQWLSTELYAFSSALQLSVHWLKWMSLPNKLNCSHTAPTLWHERGSQLCMNHKVCACSVWGCETGVRKKAWYTTDSQVICFTHPWHFRNDFSHFIFFENFAQNGWAVVMFSGRLDASFVFVGAALTFLPIKGQIVVKLMLARKQNKGWWDVVILLSAHVFLSSWQ